MKSHIFYLLGKEDRRAISIFFFLLVTFDKAKNFGYFDLGLRKRKPLSQEQGFRFSIFLLDHQSNQPNNKSRKTEKSIRNSFPKADRAIHIKQIRLIE